MHLIKYDPARYILPCTLVHRPFFSPLSPNYTHTFGNLIFTLILGSKIQSHYFSSKNWLFKNGFTSTWPDILSISKFSFSVFSYLLFQPVLFPLHYISFQLRCPRRRLSFENSRDEGDLEELDCGEYLFIVCRSKAAEIIFCVCVLVPG